MRRSSACSSAAEGAASRRGAEGVDGLEPERRSAFAGRRSFAGEVLRDGCSPASYRLRRVPANGAASAISASAPGAGTVWK